MNNSRRSFLGKLLGVVALPVVVEKLPNTVLSNKVTIKRQEFRDITVTQKHISGYSRVSKEMLSDLPFIQTYLSNNYH